LLQVLENVPHIVVSIGIAGIQFQSPAITCLGLFYASLRQENIAQVIVEFRDAPVEGDGPPNQVEGFGVILSLIRDHSEKVERIGICRLRGKGAAIGGFGVIQTPFAMVPDRILKDSG
jgi:hypothetical protein